MLQYWAVAPPATSPWYCWLKERSAIPADSAGNHCQLIPLSCCFSAALPPFTDTRQVPAWSNTGQDACEKDKPSKCHEIAAQPFSGQARTLMMWTCPLVTAPVTEQFYSLFNPPAILVLLSLTRGISSPSQQLFFPRTNAPSPLPWQQAQSDWQGCRGMLPQDWVLQAQHHPFFMLQDSFQVLHLCTCIFKHTINLFIYWHGTSCYWLDQHRITQQTRSGGSAVFTRINLKRGLAEGTQMPRDIKLNEILSCM